MEVSTLVSYVVLAGVGTYCVYVYKFNRMLSNLAGGTFGVIVVHSAIGILRWGIPRFGKDFESPYRGTRILLTLFALPCFTGQMWLNVGMDRSLGNLHPGLSVVALTGYLGHKYSKELIDVLILLNCLSCIFISYQSENQYGVVAGIIFAVNHFWIDEQLDDLYRSDPDQENYNYMLTIFTYFAMKALGGGRAKLRMSFQDSDFPH